MSTLHETTEAVIASLNDTPLEINDWLRMHGLEPAEFAVWLTNEIERVYRGVGAGSPPSLFVKAGIMHGFFVGIEHQPETVIRDSPLCDFFAYRKSVELVKEDPSFYALIMAAMRKADSFNEVRLRRAFPEVWAELQVRYDAPGGVVAEDSDGVKEKALGERWAEHTLPSLRS